MAFRGRDTGGSKKDREKRGARERELEERERRRRDRELEERERKLKERELELERREIELEGGEKKGKIKVGEEYEFRAPEFDERAFKFREMEEGKLYLIIFAISIGMGLVSYYLWYEITNENPLNLYGLLGFVPILGSMSLVYLVPKLLNLDLGHYTKLSWIKLYLFYFMLCLAFWVVFTDALSNPF